MTTLTYKDYVATIEADANAGFFHGEVINTRDVLTFQGSSFSELQAAFADTIEDYQDWCRERGKEPERPYSGSMTLRIPAELHKRLAIEAANAGTSLNSHINQLLKTRLDNCA